MATGMLCPDCGQELELHDAEIETATWRPNVGGMPFIEKGLRPAKIVSCPGCEFCREVDGKGGLRG